MSKAAAELLKGRKRKATSNRWPGECSRCRDRIAEGEGEFFEGPLRLACAPCALREGVKDDNGFKERLAQLPVTTVDGKVLNLLPFQVEDCKRISATRALLIGNQMGCGKCRHSKDLALLNGCMVTAEEAWSRYASVAEFDGTGWWADPKEPLTVNALDEASGKVVHARVRRLYRQQVKEILRRVKLDDGSETTITRAHKLRNAEAWTNDLEAGQRACVPAMHVHESGEFDLELAELFGWMVGDGHENRFTNTNGMIVTQDPGVSFDRIVFLLKSVSGRFCLNLNVRIQRHGGDEKALDARVQNAGFRAFCESHDYPWGTLSAARRVPSPIMQGNAAVVRAFLRAYMDADGSMPVNYRVAEFCSASQILVKEVASLFRRFGVWVRIRKKRARAKNSPACPYRDYWVGTFGGPSLRRFKEAIGFGVDYKQAELERVCAIKSNTNTEGVPASELICDALAAVGLPASWFGLDPKHGLSTVYLKGTQEFTRETLAVVVGCMDMILSGEAQADYAAQPALLRRKAITAAVDALDAGKLKALRVARDRAQRLIDQEVHYATIVGVEEVDYEGWVYDLEVETHHNYVAEGLLCHNTIEAAVAGLRADTVNLVFCPASVRENWVDEIRRWRTDLKVVSIATQAMFADRVVAGLGGPGDVFVGSFGVLPGSPCRGCRTLKARLKQLRKWKEETCPACDRPGSLRGVKVDGRCLGCGGATVKVAKARYCSSWYPHCTHYPSAGGSAADAQHPPHVDLTIDNKRLRLAYHPIGDVGQWIAGALELPTRGAALGPEHGTSKNIECRGCSQSNPMPEINRPIALFGDECHAFKTVGNERTKNWRGLRERVWEAGGFVFGLTGTPCEGKPMEFWEVLNSLGLARAAFGNWENYHRIFRKWFENPKGDRVPPQGDLQEELHRRLRKVQINRRRKDVLSQLPPRSETVIHVEINEQTANDVNEAVHRMLAVKRSWEDVQKGVLHQGVRLQDPFMPRIEEDERTRRKSIYDSRVEYYFRERPWIMDEEIIEAVEQALTSKGLMPTIDQLSRIRAMLSQAKVHAVQEWIKDREEEEEPIVLFSQHVSILKKIAARPGWECFHGGLTGKRRSVMVKAFQAGKIERGLAISIGAGGEGITLTRAAVCAFIDLSWNPAKNHQAESRLIRIGAERHDLAAAQKAIAESGCTKCVITDGRAVACEDHKTAITVVRFVANHVVDRLVMSTLIEKEALLTSLEWSEEEVP